MKHRIFNPYEQTQIARYGQIKTYGGDLHTAPVEYMTGNAEFCGLVFLVNQDVLIPRIETEQLVELVLQEITARLATHKPVNLAEVGTGSGAISITIAKHLANQQHVKITASDISQKALALAHKNAEKLITSDCPQIHFITSDLLKTFPKTKYEIIVANLPYIPSSYVDRLDDSVLKHEPRLALDGGTDGLMLIGRLLDQAVDFLTKDGVVLLEINHTHQLSDFKRLQTLFNLDILPDDNGANRYLRAQRKPLE